MTKCDWCNTFINTRMGKRRNGFPVYYLCNHCYSFSQPNHMKRKGWSHCLVSDNNSEEKPKSGKIVRSSKIVKTVHNNINFLGLNKMQLPEGMQNLQHMVEAGAKGILDGVKEGVTNIIHS